MGTMKVQPWGQGQGDFVVIDESEFDPERHTRYNESGKGSGGSGDAGKTDDKPKTVDELKAALAELGVEIPSGAKKPALQKLLDEALAAKAAASEQDPNASQDENTEE